MRGGLAGTGKHRRKSLGGIDRDRGYVLLLSDRTLDANTRATPTFRHIVLPTDLVLIE